MRFAWTMAVVMLFSGPPVFAARKTPDARKFTQLEARAAQAGAGKQCLPYADLVNNATDLAFAQMQAGAEEQVSTTLRSIQAYVSKIDPGHAKSAKKLKSAEILLGQAAFKLKELLLSAPSEDRPLLERTLKRVNEADSAVLLQVFDR